MMLYYIILNNIQHDISMYDRGADDVVQISRGVSQKQDGSWMR